MLKGIIGQKYQDMILGGEGIGLFHRIGQIWPHRAYHMKKSGKTSPSGAPWGDGETIHEELAPPTHMSMKEVGEAFFILGISYSPRGGTP